MKIDCPHCGVHGSIEDSLAGKKLRCPKCSKVFLLTDDVLPEADDGDLVRQEELYDSEPDEQLLAETADDTLADDDTNLETCSVCSQSFASELLVEIDSKLYCAQCQSESEDEGEGEVPEDDLLEILEEEASEQETGDSFVEEDELFESDDESEDDSGEESAELEVCSECGESLHPDFLVTVGSKRYCALCLPEEAAEGEADQKVEEAGVAGADELEEPDTEAVQALRSDDDEFEPDESLQEVCSVCGEKFHLDFLQEIDSKFYCGLCQPEVIEESSDEEGEEIAAEESEELTADAGEDLAAETLEKSKGAKGAVLALVVICAILLAVFFFGR